MGKLPLVYRFATTLVGAGALVLPGIAEAEQFCGSTAAGWNAPPGAAVFIVGPQGDIIHDLLASIGEERSHSMFSHGPGSWATHATSKKPPPHSQANPFDTGPCSWPIDGTFLGSSGPGLETISQGAAYTVIQNDNPFAVYYQRPVTWSGSFTVPIGPSGTATTNWSTDTGSILANTYLGTNEWGDQMSWRQIGSGGNTVWALDYSFNDGTSLAAPAGIFYGWHQYMDVGNTAQGYPTYEPAGQYGVVCSTSLAMWQHDALYNQTGYTGDVLPRQYTPAQTTNAAWSLFNGVWGQVAGTIIPNSGTPLFQDIASVAGLVICEALQQDVFNNAANQVVNAFVNGSVNDTNQNDWLNVVQSTGARSISPDDIGGWNSNGTGAPITGAGSSIWGWDGNQTLQWNSGGSNYGCWMQ